MTWLLLTILLQDPSSLQQALRADEPIIQPQTDRLEVIKALSRDLATEKQPASQPERKPVYYVLFGTSRCGPCKRWWRDESPKLVAQGYTCIQVDIDQEPQWGVKDGPEIWRCRRETSTRIGDPFRGYTRAEKLLEATAATVSSEPQRHRVSMTHADMVALHNQLHGGGAWTWSGDLRTHLRNSHGVEVPE